MNGRKSWIQVLVGYLIEQPHECLTRGAFPLLGFEHDEVIDFRGVIGWIVFKLCCHGDFVVTRNEYCRKCNSSIFFLHFFAENAIFLAILDKSRYFPAMNYDEIPARMIKLGVNRTWLAEQCDYSMSTLASALAPNGSNKTDKALRRIWEALDREEQRQKVALGISELLPFRVVLEPDQARFDRWMQAAHLKPGQTFSEWATAGLDTLADQDIDTGDVTPVRKTRKIS